MNTMKLNIKRTMEIGFAFFGILLLWQVYDSWCPTFLTDIFARKLYGLSSFALNASGQPEHILKVQWIVGIIMACDNLAALILLPVFGKLSDKTNTEIGKRMPYIAVGTIVSAISFPFIPYFFHKNNIGLMVTFMGIVLIFMMMYRNPAVSLMPDITPKPLRSKANGIINVVGYFGGAFATVLGIVYKLSDYINLADNERKLMTIEMPFIVASILMVITAVILFITINENKLKEELKDELEEGEKLALVETPIDDDKPMSKENLRMLLALLFSEFLWFMADNALTTYIGNYVIYYLKASSSGTMILIILGGLGSVIGFCIAGNIAEKIGRKWTVGSGLIITTVAYFFMIFIRPGDTVMTDGMHTFPKFLYIVYLVKGFGMALVFNCSFPMVLELCSANKIGQFTGYYYAASMSAQTITPILIGFILTKTLAWNTLPVYATVMIAFSLTTFVILVKNIKTSKIKDKKGLDALGDAE